MTVITKIMAGITEKWQEWVIRLAEIMADMTE